MCIFLDSCRVILQKLGKLLKQNTTNLYKYYNNQNPVRFKWKLGFLKLSFYRECLSLEIKLLVTTTNTMPYKYKNNLISITCTINCSLTIMNAAQCIQLVSTGQFKICTNGNNLLKFYHFKYLRNFQIITDTT